VFFSADIPQVKILFACATAQGFSFSLPGLARPWAAAGSALPLRVWKSRSSRGFELGGGGEGGGGGGGRARESGGLGPYDGARYGIKMTSAYGGEIGSGTKGTEVLKLPLCGATIDGVPVEVDTFRESEWEMGLALMNKIIEDGLSWPFEEDWGGYKNMDGYRAYFLSHSAFVIRVADGPAKGEIVGCFYVKPNFPGRCSHICNGGFITSEKWRRKGVGKLMAASFLKFGKELGYKASYFNLVFANNPASVALWETMGFKRIAHIPKCARLKGVEGLVDAYGYHYDLESLPNDFDPVAASGQRH
jgi:RimJ/RimL family protein N-acetyltransferase